MASGLALVDPAAGMAIAFNAAPGTIGPEEPGPYGAYATALTEMIAAGGLALDDVFARVRLRVSEVTNGGEVPWYASQINAPFFFTERAADAPPPPTYGAGWRPARQADARLFEHRGCLCGGARARHDRRLRAIFRALSRSRYARRVAAMLAVRREEIILAALRVRQHAAGLLVLSAPLSERPACLGRAAPAGHDWRATSKAPPDFALVDFGVPPPPPEEMDFVDRPVVMFWGPGL